MIKVAVYGTLRKGGALHGNMDAINAEFIEEIIIPNHAMFNMGWYPAVIERDDSSIKAEIYSIDKVGLSVLDGVEGYPSLYQRKKINDSWIYYFEDKASVKGYPEIEEGDWMKGRED